MFDIVNTERETQTAFGCDDYTLQIILFIYV